MKEDNISNYEVDRLVNFEDYAERMSDGELINIVEKMENYDEVGTALSELSIREHKCASKLCNNIIENRLGDKYLQATAMSLLFSSDKDKALELTKKYLDIFPSVVLGEIMDGLSMESNRKFGKLIEKETLKLINEKYHGLDNEEKKGIETNYEWFTKSYKI
ncbi:hypothetical protein H1Z61_15545 [Bacillus aquiflavi]|uniref:HEAT repeat domain-containing protein n=1 Tax=Bacillus aquiflavi TaxID=2672567 RepID=A0A6B3W042_9BACI|nr:hypothetical protein [Bacillus aquiflavi]MBA4538505.1 hypothetical protein [Bacillus aquiflavi]NEY82868.1 hypothetical protein [Bacillus aquiflavi]UAC48114.1 hypothetical protein K6959_16285 [Bacillus aquiflavi]